MKKRVDEVFGVSNSILLDSYIDRAELDIELGRLLPRPQHIALRGESKCGKSWLRQKMIPNAIVVQCRLGKGVHDIYVDALSQLGIKLEIERSRQRTIKGKIEATTNLGIKLLTQLGLGINIEGAEDRAKTEKIVGHDISDLRFIAEILKVSERRLVIEDFHYLSIAERKYFAFDLKALWDYGVFVIIIGVWSQNNMLLSLNPDLSLRVNELSIYWTESDLSKVLERGGGALNINFSPRFIKKVIKNCFGNVGILQTLTLYSLDRLDIREQQSTGVTFNDFEALESACLFYAEQLNPLYQDFAKRISSGIRTRKDSTGIYAHALAVILEADDKKLITGLSLNSIYEIAQSRENRIQKGNLRTVLQKFEELQVDSEGRGLVIAYNDSTDEVTVVDRQILLYRQYATVKWPWADMIAEIEKNNIAGSFGEHIHFA